MGGCCQRESVVFSASRAFTSTVAIRAVATDALSDFAPGRALLGIRVGSSMRNRLLCTHDTITFSASIGTSRPRPPSMNLRLLVFVLVLFPLLARAATTNVTVGQGGTNFNPRTV